MITVITVLAGAHHLSTTKTMTFVTLTRIISGIKATATNDSRIWWHCKWEKKKKKNTNNWNNLFVECKRFWVKMSGELTLIHSKFDNLMYFTAEGVFNWTAFIVAIIFRRTIHRKIRWWNFQVTSIIEMAVTLVAFNCWACFVIYIYISNANERKLIIINFEWVIGNRAKWVMQVQITLLINEPKIE